MTHRGLPTEDVRLPADFARSVIVDVDSPEIHINGVEFPWYFSEVTPTIITGPDGEPIPGLTVTILCADMTILASGKVVPDASE